jgi:4-hydroxy-2-oxoheptanedioate aldolase
VATDRFDLRQRLGTGETFLFSWMSIPNAVMADQMARLPIEGVCLDMQHGLIGYADSVGMIAAINAAGRPAMVRCLWNDPGLVGQSLDAGACAVIAPMVNSRAEAEALVRAAKYPPLGGRSWGGYTAQQAMGLTAVEHLHEANRRTMVFAMIETMAALERVDEIAATPGLDGLFVGPSDLSIALSGGTGIDRTGRATIAAMTRIAAAAKAHGLVAGAFGGSAELIRAYRGLGYTFIAAGVDIDLLQAGAAQLLKDVHAV